MTRAPTLQDRTDMEDVLVRYVTALDGLSDADAVLSCFTEDGAIDLTEVGLAAYERQAGLRTFCADMFGGLSHSMHMVTNFRVSAFDGASAICHSYACGIARTQSGADVMAYARYVLDLALVEGAWKMRSLKAYPQLPPAAPAA